MFFFLFPISYSKEWASVTIPVSKVLVVLQLIYLLVILWIVRRFSSHPIAFIAIYSLVVSVIANNTRGNKPKWVQHGIGSKNNMKANSGWNISHKNYIWRELEHNYFVLSDRERSGTLTCDHPGRSFAVESYWPWCTGTGMVNTVHTALDSRALENRKKDGVRFLYF